MLNTYLGTASLAQNLKIIGDPSRDPSRDPFKRDILHASWRRSSRQEHFLKHHDLENRHLTASTSTMADELTSLDDWREQSPPWDKVTDKALDEMDLYTQQARFAVERNQRHDAFKKEIRRATKAFQASEQQHDPNCRNAFLSLTCVSYFISKSVKDVLTGESPKALKRLENDRFPHTHFRPFPNSQRNCRFGYGLWQPASMHRKFTLLFPCVRTRGILKSTAVARAELNPLFRGFVVSQLSCKYVGNLESKHRRFSPIYHFAVVVLCHTGK